MRDQRGGKVPKKIKIKIINKNFEIRTVEQRLNAAHDFPYLLRLVAVCAFPPVKMSVRVRVLSLLLPLLPNNCCVGGGGGGSVSTTRSVDSVTPRSTGSWRRRREHDDWHVNASACARRACVRVTVCVVRVPVLRSRVRDGWRERLPRVFPSVGKRGTTGSSGCRVRDRGRRVCGGERQWRRRRRRRVKSRENVAEKIAARGVLLPVLWTRTRCVPRCGLRGKRLVSPCRWRPANGGGCETVTDERAAAANVSRRHADGGGGCRYRVARYPLCTFVVVSSLYARVKVGAAAGERCVQTTVADTLTFDAVSGARGIDMRARWKRWSRRKRTATAAAAADGDHDADADSPAPSGRRRPNKWPLSLGDSPRASSRKPPFDPPPLPRPQRHRTIIGFSIFTKFHLRCHRHLHRQRCNDNNYFTSNDAPEFFPNSSGDSANGVLGTRVGTGRVCVSRLSYHHVHLAD